MWVPDLWCPISPPARCEHAGGQAILDELRSAKVWNMAIFVVRYHLGPNLGKQRFQFIRELARDSITGYPGPLNYGHHFQDKELMKAFEKMEQDQAKRNQPRHTRKSTQPEAQD